MKKVKFLIPLLLVGIFALTSCDNRHFHKLGDEYSYDDTKHWNQCITTEDCEYKENEEEHKLVEEVQSIEGKLYIVNTCSVCGYSKKVEHEHKYNTTYDFDDKYHYFKCEASYCQSVLNKAPHNFNDSLTCICGKSIAQADRLEILKERGYVEVDSAEDLIAIGESKDTKFVLTADITYDVDTFGVYTFGENDDKEATIDGNGYTINYQSKSTNSLCLGLRGKLNINNVTLKLTKLTEDCKFWGLYADKTSFKNVVFDAMGPYLEPNFEDITVEGCTFINKASLQFVWRETKTANPEDQVVKILNNTFEVDTKEGIEDGKHPFGLGIIFYGETEENPYFMDILKPENRESFDEHLLIQDNTFNCTSEGKAYNAFHFTCILTNEKLDKETFNGASALTNNTLNDKGELKLELRAPEAA